MIDNISWLAIYPEIVLLTMACVIALVDLGVHSARRTATYVLTLLTLAVVAGLQAMYASSDITRNSRLLMSVSSLTWSLATGPRYTRLNIHRV